MSRLVTDAANKLHTTEKTIVYRAAQLEGNYQVETRFRLMYSAIQCGGMPKLVENYCIDVLAGREPKLHDQPSLSSRPASIFSHIPIQ